MFANTLDKLFIYNLGDGTYLSKHSVDLLREPLPLMGKKIWFMAGCKKYYENGLEYTANGHWVSVGVTLRIFHSSRRNEPYLRDFSSH
ncbi:hypothetical protein PENTCL1PPCAC_29663 [Pristionchus entomophagus]|uniref:Uncharacterized protein n=1 Tax=Pristionchus entomophagus TaxID=358040 RepID=A0AAV5UKH1_9BILA|nr:hypothetical protein PENTCL1PPCAC_29663 [Pristionchus entomophagus]